AFARGDSLEETVPVDPFALAAGVAEDARRTGASVELLRVDENGGDAVPLRPLAVGRALQNLVANAARHARSLVQVAVLPAGRWVRLVVDDDGPGIPPEDRLRVFDRFTRLSPDAAPESGGAGLGLALVAALVQGRGGTVSAGESHSGGARLDVRWPASHDA
ncbi:MAG TPA: ATP-binding protein, partial [Pseudonocardia sp.]|nr:ATP-binding protein [Pseudonocardia sp.]